MTRAILTTSWDDGHPLDLRLAEMLSHHGISGTFYIPRADKRPVMTNAQVRSLAEGGFEVGAHTLDHVVLTDVSDDTARRQIADSRRWVGDVTGRACTMFCPPCGKHNRRHVEMIREAGYLGYRTVELWSSQRPRLRPRAGERSIVEMATSIQAHPHGKAQVARNFVKRTAIHSAWNFIRYGVSGDWTAHATAMIEQALRRRGVFHLWGHSWELEDERQWDRLDRTLALMATYLNRAATLTNGEACQLACPTAAAKPQPRRRPAAELA